LKGTILRIDGDDGTLVGRVDGRQFAISHFSGDRPMLLKGTLQPDGTIDLASGAERLLALRPAEARARHLAPPLDSLTYAHVRNRDERFHFHFKDLEGKTYTEDSFAGKPYVVSITGSWCPNCRDEAPFLVELYRRYHSRGLEMAAFCFESATDPTWAPLRAFVRRFKVPYPALLAGEPAPEALKTAVPQIENLAAYPTTIYVGKDGKVRSVHTGFPSSGSGEELARVKDEIRATVERMIAEQPAR
jgi:thiol-disulfide isomerase/thioredoxin